MRLADEARRLLRTIGWSLEGLAAAWRTEKSFRQWAVANLISAILAFVLDLSGGERALIVAAGLLVLVAELVNTAVEEIVDLVTQERNPHAKKAKDCASAAVALAGCTAGLVWLVVLFG